MTTAAISTTRPAAGTAADRLRALVRLDGAACVAGGLAAVAFAGPLGGLVDGDHPGAVRLVGAFLVVYGADLVLVSRARPSVLRGGAYASAAGDAAWVIATIGLAAAGALTGAGVAVGAAMAVGTAAMGWAKASAAAKLSP